VYTNPKGGLSVSVTVKTKCPWCGETSDVTVTLAGYNARRAGAKIQDAYPELSSSDREKLITGICPVCWDKEFDEDNEGE
jgi:hypothetical protein